MVRDDLVCAFRSVARLSAASCRWTGLGDRGLAIGFQDRLSVMLRFGRRADLAAIPPGCGHPSLDGDAAPAVLIT